MFQQNSFPKCLHGFFSILNQNKYKFWNINVLCTGTATHWPTPLFYWILVFHVMRKHFVLFVPKSDMTESLTTLSIIYFFIGIFCGVQRWEKLFSGLDNQSAVWEFSKKSNNYKKNHRPPKTKTKKQTKS